MMEAMRILKKVYPNPKRTILVGHWSGEEQGLVGSRAFAADNPKVVSGLQALFNQDNGTGRIEHISMQGLTGAGTQFARWFAKMPRELTDSVALDIPGVPSSGSSDHASFICAGAPAFFLLSKDWDYGVYTWHTNRDTYDKVVFDEVKQNATMIAMLAYLASEDPVKTPRDRRVNLPVDPRTGEAAWPSCTPPARSSGESTR
jgi:Zn-dependent M28 family amino/carboxypeptidase